MPDPGCVWVHRDYNQQELRILAHFEDGAILDAYRDDPELDVHTFVQSEVKRLLGRNLDRVSVKTMNFGKLYGQGLGALAEKLNTSVDEVKSIRDAQNKALPGLKVLEDAIKDNAKAGQPILTWGGRVYYCEPPMYVDKFRRTMTFEYKLLNYLIQGSAADATKEAIIRYNKKKKHGRFVVTVYDEINICVPKQHLKTENAILKECMESIEFDVLLKSDAKIGPSWGELTKYKDVK
jgi:DNA polymerase-1